MEKIRDRDEIDEKVASVVEQRPDATDALARLEEALKMIERFKVEKKETTPVRQEKWTAHP